MDKIKSRYLGPVRVGKSRYFGKIGVDILGILTWTHCNYKNNYCESSIYVNMTSLHIKEPEFNVKSLQDV